MNIVKRMIRHIAEWEVPLDALFVQVSAIIIIRTFFEMLLEAHHGFKTGWGFYGESIVYIHFYISWLCIYLHFSILIAFFTKMKFTHSLKVTLAGFLIILTVPFLDFIHTGGKGATIAYFEELSSLPHYFLNVLNPFVSLEHVTFGVRLEIFILIIGSFILFLSYIGGKVIRAFCFSFCMYVTIFFYGYLKPLLKIAGIDVDRFPQIGVTPMLRPQSVLIMYIPPLVLLSLFIFFILRKERKETAAALVAFLYPTRIFFYSFIMIAGFLVISLQSGLYPGILNVADLSKLASGLISIGLLFAYAKILNDVHDQIIDSVSNRSRPLVSGMISLKRAVEIKRILLPLSFLFAVLAEKTFVYYWLPIWGLSHIYSVPPLRVRRFYPLGHLLLSTIAVILFLAGGSLVASYEIYSDSFDLRPVVFIFLAFFFFSHIKDYKDVEGDRAGKAGNILHFFFYPRILAVIFISGFSLSVFLLVRSTGLLSPAVSILFFIYLAAAVFLIFRIRGLHEFERHIPLALFFLIALTVLCILFR